MHDSVGADAQGASTQLGPFCRSAEQSAFPLVRTLIVGPEVVAPW